MLIPPLVDGRTVLPVLLVLLGSGCASTIAAHRPLSDVAVAEVNDAIGNRRARAVLFDQQEREGRRAKRELCRSAPGKGTLMSGEQCSFTQECECGLICQRDRCWGTSLKPSLTEPEPIEVREVNLARESTQWLEGPAHDLHPRAVPTAALERVSVRQHGRGAVEGLGLGLLTGGIAGALLGAAVASGNSSCEFFYCTVGFAAAAGGTFGGAAGIILGTVIGAVVGHQTTIEFDDASFVPPPPNARPPAEAGTFDRSGRSAAQTASFDERDSMNEGSMSFLGARCVGGP